MQGLRQSCTLGYTRPTSGLVGDCWIRRSAVPCSSVGTELPLVALLELVVLRLAGHHHLWVGHQPEVRLGQVGSDGPSSPSCFWMKKASCSRRRHKFKLLFNLASQHLVSVRLRSRFTRVASTNLAMLLRCRTNFNKTMDRAAILFKAPKFFVQRASPVLVRVGHTDLRNM